jgi:site-specific recombinase XerD
MTPLRQNMIAAMRQRGFAERTHQSYLSAVESLTNYFKCSPATLQVNDLQNYFNYLVQERNLSPASCRLHLNAVRFFFLQVLKRPSFDVELVLPKRHQKIPELLTRAEVRSLIATRSNLKHRTLLLTCYGCGLRVSELVNLKVRDIDGERRLLRVADSKGHRDRMVIVSEGLLDALRTYYKPYHPTLWLFPNREPTQSLHVQTAQRVFKQAQAAADIHKIGGIHSLRHAYATHQLEDGMPVHQLQQMLGHTDVRTTMRYVHWIHNYREGREAVTDLVARLETAHATTH